MNLDNITDALVAAWRAAQFSLYGGFIALITGRGDTRSKVLAGVVGVIFSLVSSPAIVWAFNVTEASVINLINAGSAVVGLAMVREVQSIFGTLGLGALVQEKLRQVLRLPPKDRP